MSALDQQLTAVLVFLDLSAVFEVIDHDILRQRRPVPCGVNDDVLE